MALFAAAVQRRTFSPADVLRLLVGVTLVVGGGILAELGQATIRGIERDLLSAFARLPDQIESTVLRVAQFGTRLIPSVAIIVLVVRRQWRVAALLVLAVVLATLGMLGADALVLDRDLADLLAELEAATGEPSSTFPDAQALAASTAVVTVAAPWVSRHWKRTLWTAVGVLAVLRLIAVSNPPFDLVLSVGVGVVTGSLILLVFGSPAHAPYPAELLDAVRAQGFDPRAIDRLDSEGSALRYQLVDADGDRYDVLLRTPDERDADLLERLYRQVRFRASEVDVPFSTVKRRIEHEALVRTLAARGGANVAPVARIGTTARGSAFHVSPQPSARVATPADLESPGFLQQLWTEVGALHAAGVAHRNLALESIRVTDDGGVPLLTGLDSAQTAPSENEMARDLAQMLTETALVVGPGAAVDAAVEAMGRERIATSVRMLQPLALPGATRRRAKEAGDLLTDLREAVRAATDAPDLELEDLERVRPRTLLVIGASTLAFYSLLPQLANLGDTVETFGDAQPAWIAGALVASAATYIGATLSFQGAVLDRLPFAANLRAQVAASFAGLVGPGGAGGFALTARFLERAGASGTEAGTAVAVRTVSGFGVHLALMAGFFVWAGSADIGGFSLPDSDTLLLVLAVVLAAVGVLTAIGPVRRRVLLPAVGSVAQAIVQLGRVFQDPLRVSQLFGGAVGTSMAYVVAVASSVEAFGGDIGFAQVGAAYLGAVAIATFAPTPGGLGALESSLIAGLTGFGLSSPVAVSATLTFRLLTFWLPILPGWIAFNWMQRSEEL